jgi:ribosomal protein S18 acetylase RimI-like enzyme
MVIKGPGEEFGPGSHWVLGDLNGFAEVSYLTSPMMKQKNTLYIENMSIKESLRGRGLGRLLYLKIEEFARNIGTECIQLDSEPNSVFFWKKMGFKKIDVAYFKNKVAMFKLI